MRLFCYAMLMLPGLISCSSIQTTQSTGVWSTLDWPQWQLQGRLALQYQEKSWNLSLRWQQYTDNYNIIFQGPIGIAGMRLEVGKQWARLTHDDGSQTLASNAEQLLYDQTGIYLPLSRLRYWVLASRAPVEEGKQVLDMHGRPQQIVYDDWVIQYKRYQNIEGRVIPKLILIQGHEVKLRLVIDSLQKLTMEDQHS